MHKLAFSTLSCPKWDIRTIVDAASANGYHAIDFRGYQGVIEVIDSDTFKGNSLKEIASIIHDSGIEDVRVTDFSVYPYLFLRYGYRSGYI